MSDNSPTPDGSELSSSYRILAANTIDNTFSLRQLLTEQDSRSMDSPKVFADVLAVTTMKAYAGMHPRERNVISDDF